MNRSELLIFEGFFCIIRHDFLSIIFASFITNLIKDSSILNTVTNRIIFLDVSVKEKRVGEFIRIGEINSKEKDQKTTNSAFN